MTIGTPISKGQLDADMAAGVNHLIAFRRIAAQLQVSFNMHPDADYTAASVGYSAAEVATMKSAWLTDAPQLAQIIDGLAALGAAKDFRASLYQMAGDGVA